MHQEKYNLTWHSYSDHLRSMMKELMMNEDFSDVTLVTEDKKQIKANINILSACCNVQSSEFKNDFSCFSCEDAAQHVHMSLCLSVSLFVWKLIFFIYGLLAFICVYNHLHVFICIVMCLHALKAEQLPRHCRRACLDSMILNTWFWGSQAKNKLQVDWFWFSDNKVIK